MGKREKKLKSKSDNESDDEEPSKPPILSDDDEEANEDLSLKIIEKAMLRACNSNTNRNDGVLHELHSGVALITPTPNDAVFDGYKIGRGGVTNIEDSKKNKKEKTKTKTKKSHKNESENDALPSEICSSFRNFCGELFKGDDAKEEDKAETGKPAVANESVEANPVEVADNIVLRKLLRGPRYFDPPDGGWGTCYNCGEGGHTAVNCTSAKRKKPCFVCGSLEHNAKQCAKGQDCFICKKGGHRAKDCPEKHKGGSQSSRICLQCGNIGHDMFSCKNDYYSDDLKEIQCYICKSFGHLCCVNYPDTNPREVSCYRCGQLGHTGLSCMGSHWETTGIASPSSCYRCGEGGHFARECSAKVSKRNRELSTPRVKSRKENRDYLEVRSAPHDHGKVHKRKKTQCGEDAGFRMSAKAKHRGGWITEDPGDLHNYKAKENGWRSPATPNNKNAKTLKFTASGHASSSHYSRKSHKLHFENSTSSASSQFYQHRFSASRFGNSNSDGMRRNYDW